MQESCEVRDPGTIRQLLLRDPYLHLYELGDLDPFFWPSTRWFVRDDVVALLYTAADSSVLICLTREPEPGRELLRQIRDRLPEVLYSHLTPGLFEALEPRYAANSFGEYQKMSLRRPRTVEPSERVGTPDPRSSIDVSSGLQMPPHAPPLSPDPDVVPLLVSDLTEVREFYERAYPGNWFDPRMLETERYLGIRDDGGSLVSIAGIHVYSRQEGVGVLGNVATLPAARGQGLGTRVCRELCRVLEGEGVRIGLNVARDNGAAIHCYERIGFIHEADYEERSIRASRA